MFKLFKSDNNFYMEENKLFKLISTIFRYFTIYLIVFVWIKYYVRNLATSVVLSLLATFFIDLTIRLIKNKLNKKNERSSKENKLINSYNNALIFSEDSYVINFFYNLASTRYKVEKKSSYITIKHENYQVVLFPFITFRSFSTDDLVYVLNKLKNVVCSKIVICVNTCDNEALKLADKVGNKIEILDKEETFYKLMKEYDFYPDKKLELKEKHKLSFNDFLAYALNKKRTKSYFFASVVLLFSSFIVTNNLYYVVMSSILLLLSLISFSNPKFNKRHISDNILENL